MDFETLFTASKWELLEQLAEQPLSPLQLTERSSTTLANVSQQLRLLEMAGLVKSERIPNRDKGQPRVLYSLAGDQGYLIATTTEFVGKRRLQLDARNKVILRIWFYEDENLRYLLEKAFWRIEHLLPKISALGVKSIAGSSINMGVTSDQLTELQPLVLTDLDGKNRTITFTLTDDPGKLLYSV